jgi:hypothetical protein
MGVTVYSRACCGHQGELTAKQRVGRIGNRYFFRLIR